MTRTGWRRGWGGLGGFVPTPGGHYDQIEMRRSYARKASELGVAEPRIPRWRADFNWGFCACSEVSDRLWLAYLAAFWRVIWFRLVGIRHPFGQMTPWWYLFVTGEWKPILDTLRRTRAAGR